MIQGVRNNSLFLLRLGKVIVGRYFSVLGDWLRDSYQTITNWYLTYTDGEGGSFRLLLKPGLSVSFGSHQAWLDTL